MVFNLKNIKGGVLLNKEWQSNPEGALLYFINNCRKARIIFDTSISCVCYKLYDLPSGIISPYVSIRSTNLEQPVTSILLKIGFISNGLNNQYIPCMRSKGNDTYKGDIEAVRFIDIIREIEAQHKIFLKSSVVDQISLFEPLCPAIICYSLGITIDSKNFIFDMIMDKLEQRPGGIGTGGKYVISDKDVTKNLYNVKRNVSIIIMEFMDGYENMSEFKNDNRIEYFKIMYNYELYRLGYYGYLQLDSHWGNVMINPSYPYFTNDTNDKWYGKALIIDFGRIKYIEGKNIGNEMVTQYTQQDQIITPEYRDKLDKLRFAMSISFLGSLDKQKKTSLLELIGKKQIMLNITEKHIKEGLIDATRIEEERKENERIEEERKENQHIEEERKEAQRIAREAERIEAECKAEIKAKEEAEDEAVKNNKAEKIYRDAMKWKQSQQPEEQRKAREEELSKCKAKKEEERKAREESEQRIFYSIKRDETNENLGEAAYINVTGGLPSSTPFRNCFNFWNWDRILNGNFLKKVFKGGNSDQNCPNLSIDINNIPKCFRNQKEFRDMTLILHPDKNNKCNEEDKKLAIEKFKILNSNKYEQNTNYGEINETTYEICTSSDHSNVNIKEESEELEFFKNNQEKMDLLYLESMKGKEITKAVCEKISFIFNLCNKKGENNINEINNIFEKIIEELYEILDLKNKMYNSDSQTISDDNTNISKSRIKVENLKKNITQKIKEYRELNSFLLKDNGIHTVSEDESLLITCIVDVTFRQYIINIETLNNAINSIDGLINIKNGNKMNLLNIWFGIPQNFRITQNGGVDNELTTTNNNTQIISFYHKVPVYGLKYELATTPVISLIKKYKIGNFNITNLNINSEQFNNNIKDMITKPFEFKKFPLTGGKINKHFFKKYKKTIKNKTKKIRKNKKTKRRY